MLNVEHSFWKPLWLTRDAYREIIVTSIFLNFLGIALPIFTRVVYDTVVPNFAEATLWVLFSGMLLVLCFEILFKVSRSYIVDHLGHQASARLEQEFHAHLLQLPHGYNMARTSQYFNYLQEIRDFFCHKLVPTLVDAPFVLGFLLAIFLLSPAMVLVPVVMGGVLIASQYAFHNALHKGLLINQHVIYAKQNALAETLNGRDTIRQLACYAPFRNAWVKLTEHAAKTQADLTIWQGLVVHICTAAIILNSVLLIIVGVYQIHAGNLSVGGLLAVNLLAARALTPLTSIGSILAKWPHLKSEMREVEEILALPIENNTAADSFELQGMITLQHATVQYKGQPYPALQDITLTLPKGQKLALAGPSAAGKTTLLKVLSAEIPLHSGAVRWDERDHSHLAPAALRAQLGIVDQYPYFFARTLRENLLMGLERDEAELRHVLEIVGLDEFVKAMGRGMDLPIHEGGGNLSGGQRQCLAIARALLRQSPVILMDEPTSMMDHRMEARLVQNLKFALKDKTLVVVTHRTPLLSLVDAIAVLENGRLVRYGNRADILKDLLGHAASA